MNQNHKSKEELITELSILQKKYDSLNESYVKYISEKKQIVEALSESESFLLESQNIAKLGTYTMDVLTGNWVCSEFLEKIFGIDSNIPKTVELWTQILHPDSKNQMIDYFFNEVIGKKSKFDKEYKIIRLNDKSERWVHGLGRLKFDENGRVINMIGTIRDITEKKIAEEELTETKIKFESLSNASFEAIFFSENGYCIESNTTGHNMFGYTYAEIIGMHAMQIFSEESKQLVINNIRNNYLEPYEAIGLKKDNTTFYVEIQGKVVEYKGKKVRVSAIRDITKRKEAEIKLKESEIKFRSLFENAGDGILIGNNQAIIIDVNESFCKLSGYTKEEILGNHIKFLFSPQMQKENPLRFDLINEGKNVINEREIVGKTRIVPIEMNSKRLNENYYLSIIRDLSERKNAEQTLIEQNKLLLEAKLKAEESERLKTAFLANMSHEIRTPMNGILGFADLLKNPKISEAEHAKFIDIIEKSGFRLLNIINDLVDISKIESGLAKVNISEINVNDEIKDIFNFFKPEIDNKGIAFVVNNKLSNGEGKLKSDADKISAILSNLVKNAIKFCDSGSIEIGCERKVDFLEFYVKDSGIGIEKNSQEAIFDRFVQADNTNKRASQGAGLGLSITKAYVEMLGGKMWLESKKNKGSIFYFTIPAV
ncbi:MAG TPA: hypothetical protein DDX39_07090 [Bacteroidales bacterium]|nr:MAG: hypothetical protein A2W98_12185 [Bacteroidetes bacterium GWF2_33_38]OFY91897.1 MAG: hypothetical protein A2236_06080 [Bacteroidetes bacterium RIFOXYA2_FULL_33_7]HBF88394.1 hypothetical protein [Bacteroidales bacterium]